MFGGCGITILSYSVECWSKGHGWYFIKLCVCLQKYLQPLKSPENAGLVDAAAVDAMFYQVVWYNWHNWKNLAGIFEYFQGC
jgi:hypothetical protein